MRRRIAIATFVALTGVSANISAIGLGRIEAGSALNERFDARIPLLSMDTANADQVEVRLASQKQFERAGVPRPFYLTRLNFEVRDGDDGQPYIAVTSQRPIQEPFLDFVVTVEWPRGSLVREFTVLLDPPVYASSGGTSAEPATTQPGGAAETEAEPAPSSAVAPASGTAPGSYGPVGAGDTLWSVAQSVRPEGAGVYQTMIALREANPQAFVNGNINSLRRGAVLEVPETGAITALSRAEARREFNRQMAAWRNGNAAKTTSGETASAPDSAASAGEDDAQSGKAPESGDKAATEGQSGKASPGSAGGELRVVAPTGTGVATADLASADLAASPENIRRLQNELAAARESRASLRAENEDLSEELDSLNQRLARLESAINVEADGAVPAGNGDASGQAAVETAADSAAREAAGGDTGNTGNAGDKADTGGGVAGNDKGAGAQDGNEVPAQTASVTGLVERTLDTLLANRLLLAGAGGLVLLLVLLLLVMRRRRSEGETERSLAQAAAERRRSQRATIRNEGPEIIEEEGDPAEQADFFIAYGRYDSAQEVLDKALDDDPDNTQLRVKLLEVLARRDDRPAFESEAHALRARIQDTDSAEWRRVCALAADVAPDNPLFAGSEQGAAAQAPATSAAEDGPVAGNGDREQSASEALRQAYAHAAGTAAGVEEASTGGGDSGVTVADDGQAAPEPAGGTELEFDLDPGEGGTQAGDDAFTSTDPTREGQYPVEDSLEPLEFDGSLAPSGNGDEASDSEVPAPSDDDPGLEFELPTPPDGPAEEGTPAASAERGPGEPDSPGFEAEDLELGDLDFGGDEGYQAGDDAPATGADTASVDDGDIGGGFDFGDNDDWDAEPEDEVATKLDLARAYIEMGDAEGAEALLDEVMAEGDDAQREQARSLRASGG
ncbi:FimV/HubP family polar landmark protein [Arhodomonas aquaeolei]|uniref:FimV/HubP family polar landmark protein n=1 Tax=Arhodomonas aquaeolei TaxID=2369 RepID=UPI0003694D93|nr:FimV/HubP family polar landmark protein [Arhodomonas aquaeolei]